MAEGAKVESIDAIKMFRVHLAKFAEGANLALGDAESDIARAVTWVETEQQTHWSGQIQNRHEALIRAEDALRQKQLYKDATGRQQSAADEMKQVQICRRHLAEANAKLTACKQWARRIQREVYLYRGGTQRFANTVAGSIPMALAYLTGTLDLLDRYVAAAPAAVGSAAPEMAGSAAGEAGGGVSMARSPEQMESGKPAGEGAAIRAVIPPAQVLADAPPSAYGEFAPRVTVLDTDARATLLDIGQTLRLAATDRIVMAQAIPQGFDVVVARLAWGTSATSVYLGPVDASAAKAYNGLIAEQLLAVRGDLSEALSRPLGFMVVIGRDGLKAVYDDRDQRVWPK